MMRLIAVLSTHNHWPLAEYMGMRVSEIYEWANVYAELNKETK